MLLTFDSVQNKIKALVIKHIYFMKFILNVLLIEQQRRFSGHAGAITNCVYERHQS